MNNLSVEDLIDGYRKADRKGMSKIKGYIVQEKGTSTLVYKTKNDVYCIAQISELSYYNA